MFRNQREWLLFNQDGPGGGGGWIPSNSGQQWSPQQSQSSGGQQASGGQQGGRGQVLSDQEIVELQEVQGS